VPIGLLALVLAKRAIPESSDPDAHPRPDLLGAVLLASSVGLLALAMVKAPDWGWVSAQVIALTAAAVLGLVGVVLHSARHPAPIVEIPLLKLRSFSGALAASVLYYAGFGAFVLNAVEFLTGEWHYSAIRAGLAIAPGPLCVLPFARLVAPRLAGLVGGAGRVAVIGALVNAASQTLWLATMQTHPAYATRLLPAQLIGGMGVGLTIPSLLAAGTAGIPAGWFGTGSGILNMGRQVGSVIGVAALIGVLSSASYAPYANFRHGVELIIGFFVAAAAVAAALLGRRPTAAAPPAVILSKIADEGMEPAGVG
jgi:hypothetical protein